VAVTVNVAVSPAVTLALSGFCVICGAVAVTPVGPLSLLALPPPPPHAQSVSAASSNDAEEAHERRCVPPDLIGAPDLRGAHAPSRVIWFAKLKNDPVWALWLMW
jgi:hypothetical protein